MITLAWIAPAQQSESADCSYFHAAQVGDILVTVGDVVLLRSEEGVAPFLVLVRQLFQRNGEAMMRGCWFFRRQEIESIAQPPSGTEDQVFLSTLDDENELGSILAQAVVRFPGLGPSGEDTKFEPLMPRSKTVEGNDCEIEHVDCSYRFHTPDSTARKGRYSELTTEEIHDTRKAFEDARGQVLQLIQNEPASGPPSSSSRRSSQGEQQRTRRQDAEVHDDQAATPEDNAGDRNRSNGNSQDDDDPMGEKEVQNTVSKSSKNMSAEYIQTLGRNSTINVKRLPELKGNQELCTFFIRRLKHLKLWSSHMKSIKIFHPSRWDAVMENIEEDRVTMKDLADVLANLIEQTGVYESESRKASESGRGRPKASNETDEKLNNFAEEEYGYDFEPMDPLDSAPPAHTYGHLAMEKSHPEGGSSAVELHHIRVGEKYQAEIPEIVLPKGEIEVPEDMSAYIKQLDESLRPQSPDPLDHDTEPDTVVTSVDYWEPPRGGIPWGESTAEKILMKLKDTADTKKESENNSGTDTSAAIQVDKTPDKGRSIYEHMTSENFVQMSYQVEFDQEQELAFMKAFNLFGKEYHRVARRVPRASTNDCVAWYYRHKQRGVKKREEQASIGPVSNYPEVAASDSGPGDTNTNGDGMDEAYRASLPSNHGDAPAVGTLSRNLPSSTVLVCQNPACKATINQKQFNVNRNLYRMRRMTPTWETAFKCPFWLCSKCCPPPADSRRFFQRLKHGYSEESEGSRLRRKAAVLADAQRLAREMEHGNCSFAKYAVVAFQNLENRYKSEDDTDDAAAYSKYLSQGGYMKKQARLSVKDSVEYVARVQAVYGKNSGVFCRFLKLMHRFHNGVMSPMVLAKKMTRLFHDNAPLLKAFCLFLPTTLREPYLLAIEGEMKRMTEKSQARMKEREQQKTDADGDQTMANAAVSSTSGA
eukprot:gb/GECG01005432.1/.p1 GENE.gb/GECG01005432.1/~~gb/GECG01005432.1/.p1  ORF type:complete len:931 (+),score=142.40 gb/GECG01005432.1/:1-2793(+)